MWWFDTVLRRTAPKGHYSFIYRTAPHQEPDLPELLSAFVTYVVWSLPLQSGSAGPYLHLLHRYAHQQKPIYIGFCSLRSRRTILV